ncbi:MAG: Hpt domain-containing protein [Flavobacteriaceae bacterium]
MRNSIAVAAGTASPVDLVHLARQTFGDPELEREVLRLFVTQSRIYLDRMKAAGDQRQWFEAAHTIKGSARGIGAWGVAEAAEAAEQVHFRKGSRHTGEMAETLENRVAEANSWIDGLFAA